MGSKLHLLDPPYWTRPPFAATGTVTVRTHAKHAELRSIEADGFRLVPVFRDPTDVLLSSWRFTTELIGMNHSQVPITDFAKLLYWSGEIHALYANLADFWVRRDHPDVLLLFYDDLKDDLEGSVGRLAEHRGRFDVPDEVRARIMRNIGLAPTDMPTKSGGRTAIVRRSGVRSGDGAVLPEVVSAMLQDVWDTVVFPTTGYVSVGEMRSKVRGERA